MLLRVQRTAIWEIVRSCAKADCEDKKRVVNETGFFFSFICFVCVGGGVVAVVGDGGVRLEWSGRNWMKRKGRNESGAASSWSLFYCVSSHLTSIFFHLFASPASSRGGAHQIRR